VQNVLLITIDTLRADFLGCYGGPADASPRIDLLAAQSILFAQPYSQATHTHAALTAMHTGLVPPVNGVTSQAGKLRDGVETVATRLRAGGVETASFVANLCRLQNLPRNVMHDGWDLTYCGMRERGPDKDEQYLWDRRVVDHALAWLAERGADDARAWFCWVHLMDPHGEHRPPPETWDYAARPIDDEAEQIRKAHDYERTVEGPPADYVALYGELYAAEVRGVDAQVGRLLDALDALPNAGETAVIFSADHGIELFETWNHGGHGLSLTEGVLHVPLMLRLPGHAPEIRGELVETLQVAPTILELMGLAAGVAFDGPSLLGSPDARPFAVSFCDRTATARLGKLRLWEQSARIPHDPEFDEYFEVFPELRAPRWFQDQRSLASYVSPRRSTPTWLAPDDAEHGRISAQLAAELDQFLERMGRGGDLAIEKQVDGDLEAQLRALGYL
jgi:arylsulfatase